MFESNRRVADALDVPAVALMAWIYVGFAVLAVGGMAKIGWLGCIAAVVGTGLVAVGLRAAVRPARAFDPGVLALQRVMSSSKRVGMFYVLGGGLWIALSVGVALGG